ncbi:MAG: flagellar hook-basal body complex protein [Alphaproteobacteria bacterium]|jgi:flagellar hook protein FlgE
MSLTNALFASESGIRSNARAIAVSSDNIANSNTIGFKGSTAYFKSIVAGSTNTGTTLGAGVSVTKRLNFDQQGAIVSTGVTTDLAITGKGSYVVKKDKAGPDAGFYYTREGSFRINQFGQFENASGYILYGHPLDTEGRRPGEAGNINTTDSTLLDSLEPITLSNVISAASATTKINFGVNLDAKEPQLLGAFDIIDPQVPLNDKIAWDEIIQGNNDLSWEQGTNDAFGNLGVGDQLTLLRSDGQTISFEYGGYATSNIASVATPIFGAADAATEFALGPGTANDGQGFTITPTGAFASNAVQTFKFQNDDPSLDEGEFNSLDTLVSAIIKTSNGLLTAKKIANGTGVSILISATDARQGLNFANISGAGPNFTGVFGLANFDPTETGLPRFNTLKGLNEQLNDTDYFYATVQNPTFDSTLKIGTKDPKGSIQFTGVDLTPATPPAGFNLLTSLGFSISATTLTPAFTGANNVTSAPSEIVYDVADIDKSIASGSIDANFRKSIRIYDSLGTAHDLILAYVKLGQNKWGVELFAADKTEINTSQLNGLITTGEVEFNGDGSIRTLTPSLLSPFNITWKNGALASTISLDLGSVADPLNGGGLTQLDGKYTVYQDKQNGYPVGSLQFIDVDATGKILINFTNGQSRSIYQIGLGVFSDENSLTPLSDNVFQISSDSGEVNVYSPGENGAGLIEVKALEQANVDLSTELTRVIVTQRAFQSNTRIISVVDKMTEDLVNTLR